MNFGRQLHNLRIQAGLKSDEAARILHIDGPTLRSWELGGSEPIWLAQRYAILLINDARVTANVRKLNTAESLKST